MPVTRRHFLRSSLGLASASAGLGSLALPGLALAGGAGGKKLVLIVAAGGWDVTWAFDPKFGSSTVDGPDVSGDPAEEVRTIQGIPLAVNDAERPALSEFFETWGSNCTVVNGIWVGSIAHTQCQVRMLTGSRSTYNPDLAAVVGYELGQETAIPYLDLGGRGYTGPLASTSGRTGIRNQLSVLLDRDYALPPATDFDATYPGFIPGDADHAAIQALVQSRAQRFHTERMATDPKASILSDYFEAATRAERLMNEGAEFAEGLSLGLQLSIGQQAAAAIDLFGSGLCHTVSLDSRLSWDTHDDITEQQGLYDRLFTGLGEALTSFSAANSGALPDDTVFVVVSEMTRTPKLNATGGKDHWPVTSALVIGGSGTGLRGGQSLGGTDEGLNAADVDLSTGQLSSAGEVIRYDHFAAGLLDLMDIDPAGWFPGITPLGGLKG